MAVSSTSELSYHTSVTSGIFYSRNEAAQQLQEQELQQQNTLRRTNNMDPSLHVSMVIQTDHVEPEQAVNVEPDNNNLLVPTDSQGESNMVVTTTTHDQNYNCCTAGLPRWTYRNLYAVCLSFMFTFSAFYGLQGLQSSLNQQLGIISLSMTYGFYFLSGFVSTAMVRLLSTKYTLLFGYLCYTIYTLVNFHPRLYTLIPVAALVGVSTAPIWAGISTHLGITALRFAVSPNVNETFSSIVTKFTGISFFALQMSQILGNIVSSLVLFPYSSFTNSSQTFTLTGNFCSNMEAQDVTSTQLYILLCVYLAFNILGITILLVFVSKIPQTLTFSKSSKNKCRRYCLEPFVDLMSVHVSWKMLLLGPLSLYNGATIAFSFSSYTKNVVSSCVGVGNIGFALIVLGLFSAVTSVVYSRLNKYIHRVPFALSAALMNLFFFLFLVLYQPLRPSYVLVFLFAIFWGIAGGIWNTLSSSLVGILFPTIQDSAYSAFRMWFSLGYAIGFAITEIDQLKHQCYLMIILLVVCLGCYILLEIFISKWGQRTCCSCHKSLGVFDGPKTKYDHFSENLSHELTENMLETNNLGQKELLPKPQGSGRTNDSSSQYVPPVTSVQRHTGRSGRRGKRRQKISLATPVPVDVQVMFEINERSSYEDEIQLFHTTVF